jgi:uncharacterized membrane protein
VSDAPEPSLDGQAAWGIPSSSETHWPVVTAVLVAIILQLVLPNRVVVGLGAKAVAPAVEGALLLVLLVTNPGRLTPEQRRLRLVGIALIALISLANTVSLIDLIHALLYDSKTAGRPLVYASVPIWLTNVIAFGLWYWELDRGGPARRTQPTHPKPDFLFPQMGARGSDPSWTPDFSDYLYTSFTNATAFSPTDTMPLTRWAKLLMALQSMASLVTVAVVVSRAVNILN